MAEQIFRGRQEDAAFLRGSRRFVADGPFIAEQTEAPLDVVFVRSDVAHGVIRSLETEVARALPGVVEVFTAGTIGLGPFVHLASFERALEQSRYPLAHERVRYVGEALALVVAESVPVGVDAAEHVGVDIEVLAPVMTAHESMSGPLLYPASATNLVHALDDPAGTSPSLTAATTISLTVENPKVSSLTMECDGIVVRPTEQGGIDVWCTSQGVQTLKGELCTALDLPPEVVRVRSPAVGGGFGGRATLPVEFAAVAKAALDLGRSLRWIQSRTEQLTGQPHGRGLTTSITLGADAEGRLCSLEADVVADAGATAHMQGALLVSAARQLPGLYNFEHITTTASAWLTNTTPVGAYRGAGQPEANHARERAIDVLARSLGLDPIAFRLANLVSDGPGPVQPHGVAYDAVAPQAALARAVERADVSLWRSRQAARVAEGASTRLGIGVSCYAQTSGRGEPADAAELRLQADGTIEVWAASPAHGQGHAHTFANLIADRLGIDPSLVNYSDADTHLLEAGLSTGGSRSTQVLGQLIDQACAAIVDEARPLVADRLEVAPNDLVVAPAGFGRGPGMAVVGVPTRRVEWVELASDSPNGCLASVLQGSAAGATHPFGAHVSIVEVDVETGRASLVHHVGVDDAGAVLEPTLLAGQQHGGNVAGLGQAMGEAVRYDTNGNPLTSTLGTYLVPTIETVAGVVVDHTSTPTDRNSLGTRGIGENGCNGATAAFHNAVLDALAEWGVVHIDLPLDPEMIWQSIRSSSLPGA